MMTKALVDLGIVEDPSDVTNMVCTLTAMEITQMNATIRQRTRVSRVVAYMPSYKSDLVALQVNPRSRNAKISRKLFAKAQMLMKLPSPAEGAGKAL